MKRTLSIFFAALMLATAMPSAAQSQLSREETKILMREVLREDPNLVLDILRDHSELVLDIAQQGSNQRRLKVLTAQWKKELDIQRPAATADRPVRGRQDAPVTIMAFSDFTCPYCTQASNTISTLLRDNEGKARLIFKHYPLEGHKFARLAAEYHVASSFQGEEKYWALYDALFKNGPALNEGGEPLIRRLAEEAGLDMKKLAADLRGKASKIRAIIEEDIADARQNGLEGTPNFLVNNLIIRGALAPELFNQAIIMAHDHARGSR